MGGGVSVGEGVMDGVQVGEGVQVGVSLGIKVADGVQVGGRKGVHEAVTLGVMVGVNDGVTVTIHGVTLPVGVMGVGVRVTRVGGRPVAVSVGVGVGLWSGAINKANPPMQ